MTIAVRETSTNAAAFTSSRRSRAGRGAAAPHAYWRPAVGATAGAVLSELEANEAFLAVVAGTRILASGVSVAASPAPPAEPQPLAADEISGAESGTEFDWLAVFDPEDIDEFRRELGAALAEVVEAGRFDALHETIRAWRATAQSLRDPMRRDILLGPVRSEDFVEVGQPT